MLQKRQQNLVKNHSFSSEFPLSRVSKKPIKIMNSCFSFFTVNEHGIASDYVAQTAR